jgi:hypothetical protein
MKTWINTELDDMRSNISSKKKTMHDIGMNNQYQKQNPTSIGDVGIKSHDSDTNKILRQEGIYRIKVLNDLITEINKNKELCLTDK